MLAEALVLAACIQNQGGCTEASSAYYQGNKDLQIVAKNVEDLGNRVVQGNEWIVYAATPFYAAMSGQQSNFKLSRQWLMGINVKKELVVLQWSY